ncbi:DNA replication/repair protein RecF [Bifidobacterium gallicum]|uniref:DNA replication and repair protein RecF n=1 Tax=Bifidobacterium gallicum DSM 20093 = LMG 11596 TaxID=561180 RepID=D1NWD3_9BIFI|nr:DNA replication/repair protein RecF [Bifidobacterium gallicum]EFA22419.1 DNA replication and repair protein RecF [Bifidobacterium gallicum DSM 20093 = LMG 11596]KFI60109.1 DNA repair protein RecF [Bifidobacterium gallicum DSM 20093 = LMG 11596]
MRITRLALDHFRSWNEVVLDFPSGITMLQGHNGLGKTNLVEAIEVLSTGSSHRTSSSLPLVQRGQQTATIRANVQHQDRTATYEATIRAKGANRARINSGSSLYLRDIVGQVPSVTFSPDDQRLVSGDPSARRRFLDQAGSQLVAGYAQLLQDVQHVGRQRAALLKSLGQHGEPVDTVSRNAALASLEVWTGQFISAGVALTRARQQLVQRLAEPFSLVYSQLAGPAEQARLTYEPSFDEVLTDADPAAALSRHFQRLYAGETSRGVNLIGPQRDDLSVQLNGMDAHEFASNGEMWAISLALKMALTRLLAEYHAYNPVVILDDVFAQLDESRRGQILSFAAEQDQVIMTVAAASDIPQLAGVPVNVVDVQQLAAQSPPLA